MVEKDALKQIHFLKDLPDHTLEKVGAIAQMNYYGEEQILFRQKEEQSLLYMLVSGSVFLTSRDAYGKALTLDEVLPGRTFGVPALLDESSGTFTAICAEECTMITILGKKMRRLFEEDFETGHLLMKKVVELFKVRVEMHTDQFLHSLKIHPEISKFKY